MEKAPNSSPESRRTFLRNAAAFVTGSLALTVKGSLETVLDIERLTDANTLLRQMPDELPDGTTIEKRETPGARWLMVVVSSGHESPFDSTTIETSPVLNEKQREIGRAILAKHDRYRTESLYPALQRTIMFAVETLGVREWGREGMAPEAIADYRQIIAECREELAEARKAGPRLEAIKRKGIMKSIGPDGELAVRGVIDWVPVEDVKVHEEGMQALRSGDEERFRAINLRRERIVMESLAAGSGLARAVQFGADHRFEEAYRGFNADNPANRCSMAILRCPEVMELLRRAKGLPDELMDAWGVPKEDR